MTKCIYLKLKKYLILTVSSFCTQVGLPPGAWASCVFLSPLSVILSINKGQSLSSYVARAVAFKIFS